MATYDHQQFHMIQEAQRAAVSEQLRHDRQQAPFTLKPYVVPPEYLKAPTYIKLPISCLSYKDRASNARHMRITLAKQAIYVKQRNKNINRLAVDTLDYLFDQNGNTIEERLALLELMNNPLDESYSEAADYDDGWQKGIDTSNSREWSAPSDKMGSMFAVVAENLKYRIRFQACWRMEAGTSDSEYKRLTLDPLKYLKKQKAAAKARQWHGIRDIVFFPKTDKKRPLPQWAAKSKDEKDISGIVAASGIRVFTY